MTTTDLTIQQIVDPITYPLFGSSLIEASAGTGKTWTIAALYVRLVLGHRGFEPKFPEQILVLTFTKAAARELRDRIRKRLNEAADFFMHSDGGDPFLTELKNNIPENKHAYCARLLEIAAQSMDLASISTIHAWCDKVLKQHAFDSGSLFDQDLTQDISIQRHHAIWDYWREHIVSLPANMYADVLNVWSGPGALKNLAKNINPADLPAIADKDLVTLLSEHNQERKAYIQDLKQYWRHAAPELLDWLYSLGKDFSVTQYHKDWIAKIEAWVQDEEAEYLDLKTGWQRLNPQGVLEKYKGSDLKIIDACKAIDELHQSLQQIPATKDVLVKHAFVCLGQSLRQNLVKDSLMDFDSLLIQMQQALLGSNGDVLATTLKKQYPVILVDEFQDTDPVQYDIFNKIYQVEKNDQNTTIIFIGDPKQSIYRFRGADIYTYIKAAQDCGDRIYTLNKNYRSAENMVNAVNSIFSISKKSPFITADKNQKIGFSPVLANGLDEKLVIDDRDSAAISACWLDNGEKPIGVTQYRLLAAQACANEITQLLNKANKNQAFIKTATGDLPICPADIAVLVNNMAEAKLIQHALSANNIRSVYLSERTSVYDSQQAIELVFILTACLEPRNTSAILSALACPALGIAQTELLVIKNDDLQWDIYVERFIKYNEIWHKKGILPMFYKLLHDFAIPANLLADDYNGERSLTNFLHLVDLLQNAATGLDGAQALLEYLNRQIEHQPEDDTSLLRLESDDDLVKITTIHKSKGLEYPIVFLPFIGSGSKNINKPEDLATPININVDSKPTWVFNVDDDLLENYQQDSLGEEVRKLYVALTRARYAVWVALKHDSSSRLCGLSHVLNNQTKYSFDLLCADYSDDFQWFDLIDDVDAYIEPKSHAQQKKKLLNLTSPAVKQNWWISSYSALHLGKVVVDNYLEHNLIEEQISFPEAYDIYADHPEPTGFVDVLADIPKGSSTGTFLHSLLQTAAKNNFTNRHDLRDMVARRCAVLSWQEHIDLLYEWLINFIDNNWAISINNSQFKLTQLNASMPELEFLLPIHTVNSHAIDKLITAAFHPGLKRPVLSPQLLNGMFKGYIDLCFENIDGLYYVVDYKSNYLGDSATSYNDNSLIKAMLNMRYDVQMLLYSLVLHKQLKMRMVDYDYEANFGGAIYMFMRGQNAPNQGLVSFRPDLKTLNALEDLFVGLYAE